MFLESVLSHFGKFTIIKSSFFNRFVKVIQKRLPREAALFFGQIKLTLSRAIMMKMY